MTSSYSRSTKPVLQPPIEPRQYTALSFTEQLAEARIAGSIGTVGDALDNALMESTIGLFKTELIKPRGPWRSVEQVEIATLEYVDWLTIADQQQAVVDDVLRIRNHPLVPATIPVHGYLYDVKTGRLTEVAGATSEAA